MYFREYATPRGDKLEFMQANCEQVEISCLGLKAFPADARAGGCSPLRNPDDVGSAMSPQDHSLPISYRS